MTVPSTFSPTFTDDYRAKHKDEINNKAKEDYHVNKDEILRRHILWNLNRSQNTEKPKQASIDKYNLKFDEKLHKWY